MYVTKLHLSRQPTNHFCAFGTRPLEYRRTEYMRRSFTVLIWILLGAFAASLGVGTVLLSAKHDRDGLQQKIAQQNEEIARLQQERNQTILDANQHIEQAAAEASATHAQLQAITDEQRQLSAATPLLASYSAKRWPETVSFALDLSLRTPPNITTTSTDTELTSTLPSKNDQPVRNWLNITRYDDQRFSDLVHSLTQTQTLSYRLDQTWISGVGGISPDGVLTYVLRAQRQGQITHLIYVQALGSMTEQRILDSLSTLVFATY